MTVVDPSLTIDPHRGVCVRTYRRGKTRVLDTVGRDGYVRLWVNHEMRFAHRVIWEFVNGPIPKGGEIDHVDGNRSNNAISNLRLVNSSQNGQNLHGPSSTKKYPLPKGVHMKKGRISATIGLNGKQYYLGCFDTIEEAAAAYQGAAAILHTHNPHAKKEGPAETDPKGLQHPGGETTTRNTGISV